MGNSTIVRRGVAAVLPAFALALIVALPGSAAAAPGPAHPPRQPHTSHQVPQLPQHLKDRLCELPLPAFVRDGLGRFGTDCVSVNGWQ
jgi:hypothetical protein